MDFDPPPDSTQLYGQDERGCDDDPRLARALEEYEQACARGERPLRSAFLRRHEAIADELADCLDGLDRLRSAGVWFQGDVQVPPERLGEYRIIRELGRGGMGIVYEAVQSSSGLRVALKLLPSTAAMDPRQVQRFQLEVQAAGHLRHPRIVPIYSVGFEGGVHYYSMQFISGRPLAAWIEVMRRDREARPEAPPTWAPPGGEGSDRPPQPPDSAEAFFRAVARIGLQAAEALDHAHGLGVIHRDIKPGNLLIDDQGDLWVADFGLARLHGASGLTATGDLVGTLRYMSPEQVVGDRGVVDHRTDLYSLGVTLYESAALVPAFPGGDMAALVPRILNEEPPPPSHATPQLPRDLETIILKAMAKEPSGRYSTARAMADDLRRFLDQRPIQARRPSVIERGVRWARRHRPIAAALAGATILAVVCLAISTLVIWGAMSRVQSESDARRLQLDRAEVNLDVAHRALELYLDSAETWFPRGAGDDRGDVELLRTALQFYEQIAASNEADARVLRRTFEAYGRIGDIRLTLGRVYEAEDAYRRAMRIMIELMEDRPGEEDDAFRLAAVLRRYADLLRRHAVFGPAEWAVDQSIRLLRGISGRSPDDASRRFALAQALNLRASIAGETARTEKALADSNEALGLLTPLEAVPPDLPPGIDLKNEMAVAYIGLGSSLQLAHRLDEAEAAYRKALKIVEVPEAGAVVQAGGRESLARCRARLGELQWEFRRTDDAIASLEHAAADFRRLSDEYPRVPRYRRDLARLHELLSRVYWVAGRPEDSEASDKAAYELDPKLEAFEQTRLNNIAWYLVTTPDVSSRNPAKAVEFAELVVANEPGSWACWNTLAVARYRNGDWTGAEAAFRRSIELYGQAQAFDGFGLAMTLWRLGRQDEARSWYRRSEELRRRHHPEDLELLRFLAEARSLMGEAPEEAEEPPATIAEVLARPSFGLPGRESALTPAARRPPVRASAAPKD